MSTSVLYEARSRVAVVTLDNPPVNGLNLAVREGVVAAVRRAFEDSAIGAIVLAGGEQAFSAGADVRELGTPRASADPTLREVIRLIEDGPKPVIAAIAGVCMGGGFELALGCHYRVAKADAAIALPEIKLGLLPGAGGTQRLPRAVGFERALKMILSGETRNVQDFATTALFDEIVTGDLDTAAVAFAERLLHDRQPPKRLRDVNLADPNADAVIAEARNAAFASKHLPAPLKCIDAVAATVRGSFDEGLQRERELFEQLLATPESRSLRHVFRAEREAGKIPGIPADTPTRPIELVGVIGAGTMGRGIAMTFLNASIPVVLHEISNEALDRGITAIRETYESSVKKGRLNAAERDARLALLGTASSYSGLEACDLVIEAVFEDLDVKQRLFAALSSVAKPGAILASNTSTLDLNRLAIATRRASDVIGLHFFSPANVMRLLEVVRGAATASDVLATCMRLAKRIKKVGVVSGVCDGFIGNRMYHRYQVAAEELLVRGATPQQVDEALERFGMAMGPFRVGDLTGLDVGWAIRKHRAKQNPGLAASRIPDRLCEAGRFGQKNGGGWYRYEPGRRDALPDPAVDELIAEFRAKRKVAPRSVSDAEIIDGCIRALVTEGARILEDGIALRASDIDVVWINGYGFPAYRGGPMHYAHEIGLAPSPT